MNEFGLKFIVPDYLSDKDAERNFYWTTSGTGSFITDLFPRLGGLGPVNPINADLVRLAVLVWAADRSVPRAKGNVNWTRPRPLADRSRVRPDQLERSHR